MFVQRNYDLTPHDDWELNVQPRLGSTTESVEVHHPTNDTLVGWRIQEKGE
jgi:hypothetical protein